MADTSEFYVAYYEERLRHYEQLELAECSDAELTELAGEASSLRKFMDDILDEGYPGAVERLVKRTNAMERLQRFLSDAMHALGPPSERDRFYLMSTPVSTPPLTSVAFLGGRTTELHDYLDHLDKLCDEPVDITSCFSNTDCRQRWEGKTQILLQEMAAFLRWIQQCLSRLPHMIPVPLLRDTLLIHLGLKWLASQGAAPRQPRPVLIGRAFANLGGDGRQIHGALGDIIYRVLHDKWPCNLITLRKDFASELRRDAKIPTSFTQACTDQLATLELDGPPLFIESGVQGTFTLLLLSLLDNQGEMVFYTTTPWLYWIYAEWVFQRNYNYLREMETIVAHDYLFRFHTWHEGNVTVQETTDEVAYRLARYEIHLFKKLINQDAATSPIPIPHDLPEARRR